MLRIILATGICLTVQMAVAFDHSHKDWDSVLKKYQNVQGFVRYKALKADSAKDGNHLFEKYLTSIQEVRAKEFASWSREQQMAFLINAYNALTVKLIINHYPITSIKKIGGIFTKPWGMEFFSLFGGEIKSLDPIEHKWLRPKYKDYRIHAAVNCASYSCPPLRREAYVAEKLDEQLNEQMTAWLQDKERNNVDLAHKDFEVSKIFDWYKDDFETWGGGVVKVILKHAKIDKVEGALQGIQLKYLPYNWDLNEAP